VKKWHGHEKELARVHAEKFRKVAEGFASGDFDVGNVTVGKAIGLIHDLPKAGELINRTVAEVSTLFKKFAYLSIAA
jgi:nitronate monooxygenase